MNHLEDREKAVQHPSSVNSDRWSLVGSFASFLILSHVSFS